MKYVTFCLYQTYYYFNDDNLKYIGIKGNKKNYNILNVKKFSSEQYHVSSYKKKCITLIFLSLFLNIFQIFNI